MNLKSVKEEICFDGINFTYREKVLCKVPKSMIGGGKFEKKTMNDLKTEIIDDYCEV